MTGRAKGASAVAGSAMRAVGARTLYLAFAQTMRVTSTGESLVLTTPEGQLQRIPIARVLRVVCSAAAEWSGAALGLCMERGVSITWIDRQRGPLGHLRPHRLRSVELAVALDALSSDDDGWSNSYQNWLRHQRLQVIRGWRTHRQEAGSPVGAQEWGVAMQRYVYRDEQVAVLPEILHGMAAALVNSRLCEYGLQPHYWCGAGAPIALANDLTRLTWARMNLCGGPLAAAIENPREAAALFEKWTLSRSAIVHEHLASLRAHAHRELSI